MIMQQFRAISADKMTPNTNFLQFRATSGYKMTPNTIFLQLRAISADKMTPNSNFLQFRATSGYKMTPNTNFEPLHATSMIFSRYIQLSARLNASETNKTQPQNLARFSIGSLLDSVLIYILRYPPFNDMKKMRTSYPTKMKEEKIT